MVMLLDLSDPARGKESMLDLIGSRREMDARRMRLMETIDRINRTEGRGTVRIAAQGAKVPDWQMRRKRLSPAWTTCLQELLRVGGQPGIFRCNDNQTQI